MPLTTSRTNLLTRPRWCAFSYAALRCSPPLSDSATLKQCNCGVHRHSQNVVFLVLCMPLCGVYRRLACKFSKVSREEIGSATEEEKKNDSATEESFTDSGLAVCKKCGRAKQGSLHIAEDICDRCRNKRSAMSKWFGEWPIEMFEDMPEEQQKCFWLGE